MKTTLGECLKIAKEYEREVQRLIGLRREEAFAYHEKDEEPEPPSHGVVNLTEEIDALNEKIRLLRRTAAQMNLVCRLDYTEKGETITLAEGIVLLGQLLREREQIQPLVAQPERKREVVGFNRQVQYRSITYDPNYVDRYAKEVENKIRRLRTAIDRANVTTYVELDIDG